MGAVVGKRRSWGTPHPCGTRSPSSDPRVGSLRQATPRGTPLRSPPRLGPRLDRMMSSTEPLKIGHLVRSSLRDWNDVVELQARTARWRDSAHRAAVVAQLFLRRCAQRLPML